MVASGHNDTNAFVVELRNMFSASSIQYSFAKVGNSIEFIDEVVFANNEVVLVGHVLTGGGCELVLRKASNLGNVTTSGDLNTAYVYYNPTGVQEIDTTVGTVMALPLNGQYIMVGYQCMTDTIPECFTRYRLIDLTLMANVNSLQYVVEKSVFPQVAFVSSLGVAYTPVVVNQTGNALLAFSPFLAGGYTTHYYTTEDEYRAIAPSQKHVVMVGNDRWLVQNVAGFPSMTTPHPMCLQPGSLQVYPLSNLSPKALSVPLTYQSDYLSMPTPPFNSNNGTLSTRCASKLLIP